MPSYKWILTLIAPLMITIVIAIANLFLTVETLKANDRYQEKKLDIIYSEIVIIRNDVKGLIKNGK